MDKDEIIKTREPKRNIVCKDCKHRLRPVKIGGETIERHTYGSCGAYANKPSGILWNGDSCELYEKE